MTNPQKLFLRPGHPDFLDLPWDRPFAEWQQHTERMVELPRGESRHPILFVNYSGVVYSFKQLPGAVAEKEYHLLSALADLSIPSVEPVGFAEITEQDLDYSLLITRYLDASLPYSDLFTQPNLARYRERLLDALAGLLVELHISGVYWGDCSLYNALFRRDAGQLQAYLVDAETAEIHESLSDGQREGDLQIMLENVSGGLYDLVVAGLLNEEFDAAGTAEAIRRRYLQLWTEVRKEVVLGPEERYKIQEHVARLHDLGFSIASIELRASGEGDKLRLKLSVTDRQYHRHQIHSLTGINAEESQARLLLNEIQEVRAQLAAERGQSIPTSVAAYQWYRHRFRPVVQALKPSAAMALTEAELYSQFLEEKWFLSEREQRDVGQTFTLDQLLHQSALKNKKENSNG
jgi:hypothetical protein